LVTIKDIAKITGVSTATVSNVLNSRHGAAGPAKTREIFEIAENLHYRPNSLAKSLKERRTKSIGVITEDLTVFFTPEIVDGIDEYCEENGFEIILANMRLFKRYSNDFTETPKHKQLFDSMISTMVSKQVEGIIYIGYHCREISFLPSRINIPFAFAYCFPQEPLYPSVLFDDESAAYDVAIRLLQKNHRNIGVINGLFASRNTQMRLKGVQRALFEYGVSYDEQLILYGDWTRESGYALTDTLLDRGATAIFAFNDMMASGVYKRCIERHLAVGKDISLFGYDDIEICEGYAPAISSVALPLREMGKRSAMLVLSQIKRNKISNQADCKPVLLPCIIHERDSVSQIPLFKASI